MLITYHQLAMTMLTKYQLAVYLTLLAAHYSPREALSEVEKNRVPQRDVFAAGRN